MLHHARPFVAKGRPAPSGAAAGLLSLGVLLIALLLQTAPLRAEVLLRDPDIEHSLNALARPVLTAAGLSPSQIRILIIKDSSLNAFVIDGRAIFIHSGLVLKLKSAAQLQAVIAHEAGHIANGHISRRLSNVRSARSAAGLGLALSLLAGAAGGSKAGAGVAIGATSSARRVLLAHTRGEESAADQSSARYMARAGIDPKAMVEVLEMFRGQEALSVGHQDPYMLSHPLTRDRLRAAMAYAASYRPTGKPDPKAAYWFARARGKLGAFLRGSTWALREAKKAPSEDIRLMMTAIAYHRIPKPQKAIRTICQLAAKRPRDAYVYDLMGQILLESRQTGPAAQAYRRAVALAPKEPLIAAGYGRALLAQNTGASTRKALSVLESARAHDPRDARLLRDLALAYAKTGHNGMASLATAERFALQGNLTDAGLHAKRAADLLPRGSVGWNRAQDVLRAAEQFAKRRKRT